MGVGMPSGQPLPNSSLDPFSMLKEIRVKVMILEGGPEFRQGLTGRDKTDPYITICLQSDSGQKGKVEKTSYKNDAGGNAAFNETLNLIYSSQLDTLHFELFDWNQVTAHELLATQNVSLRTLFSSHNAFSLPVETKVELVDPHGKASGYLSFSVNFIPSAAAAPMPPPAAALAGYGAPQGIPRRGSQGFGGGALRSIRVREINLLDGPEFCQGRLGKDKTDPFVRFSLQPDRRPNAPKAPKSPSLAQTEFKKDAGKSATWPQAVLDLEPRGDVLHVELWDHNDYTDHELLGCCDTSLAALMQEARGAPYIQKVVMLGDGNNAQKAKVSFVVEFIVAHAQPALAMGGAPADYRMLQSVTVTDMSLQGGPEYCQGYTGKDKTDPFLRFGLQSDPRSTNTGVMQKTTAKDNAGSNASWQERLNLPYAQGRDFLHLELWDNNAVTSDELLGNAVRNLQELFVRSNGGTQPVQITETLIRQKDQKHMGHVTFSVRFEMHSGGGAGGPSVSGKELQVKVVRLQDGPSTAGFMDKTDPYIKLMLQDSNGRSTMKQVKTQHVSNAGGNATFNATFTFPITPGQDILSVELWDKDDFNKDDFLGRGMVNINSLCIPNSTVSSQVRLEDRGNFKGNVLLELLLIARDGVPRAQTSSSGLNDWLPYCGPPGYLSKEEALRTGGPGLNPPHPPAGYKFAGWAPPPDGRNHDGSWKFENNMWLKLGQQPKVTWTHVRDPGLLQQQQQQQQQLQQQQNGFTLAEI
uniref:C2 domain-containing protein n=1 Tax=Cryptomonas curvata TaxID=233186 RepID=A0A7S0MX40_9CRYP